ncbi:MAG: signal recognition particle-docking protein FtsY [Pseudomonadota bacterium]
MFRSKSKTESPDNAQASAEPRRGLFGRLKDALTKTRSGFVEGVVGLFAGRKTIDASIVEEIETLLLSADVGVSATDRIVDDLTARLKRNQLGDGDAVLAALRENMLDILSPVNAPFTLPATTGKPFVILTVGVNGAGKTTTIGKLAKRLTADGKSVMLAAGDTFRAAAIDQLNVWGERNNVPVIAQHPGADSASVVFDALQAATARGVDVLIADTAGRLHTQAGLMEELKKVRRVLGKIDDSAPHETLLVLDAGTGQNALNQAEQFAAAVDVSGIALTKLDGTAKGGVILSIADRLELPIRFIGVGEAVEDLRDFDAAEFVDALLSQ